MNYTTFKAGNNEYKLALTTRGMVELEKKLGCNPVDILMRASENNIPKVTDMVAVLWASALKYNHGIKYEDCFDIMDEYIEDGNSVLNFLDVMVEVFKVSGIIKEDANPEEEEKNAVAG